MFIFTQRNNIVKNHQLIIMSSFIFPIRYTSVVKRKKQKTKQKKKKEVENLCETNAHESVSVMAISHRGLQGVMYDVCYLLIAIMC